MTHHLDMDDDVSREAKGLPTLGQLAGVEALRVATPLIEAATGVPVQLDGLDEDIAADLQRARAAEVAADALAAYTHAVETGVDGFAEYQAAVDAAVRWAEVRGADYRPTVLGVSTAEALAGAEATGRATREAFGVGEPLPAWATEVSHITATCTECDEQVESEDGVLLFATAAEAVEYITECGDGQVDGDTLVCRACLDRRQCATEGHPPPSDVARAIGYRWCERCRARIDNGSGGSAPAGHEHVAGVCNVEYEGELTPLYAFTESCAHLDGEHRTDWAESGDEICLDSPLCPAPGSGDQGVGS